MEKAVVLFVPADCDEVVAICVEAHPFPPVPGLSAHTVAVPSAVPTATFPPAVTATPIHWSLVLVMFVVTLIVHKRAGVGVESTSIWRVVGAARTRKSEGASAPPDTNSNSDGMLPLEISLVGTVEALAPPASNNAIGGVENAKHHDKHRHSVEVVNSSLPPPRIFEFATSATCFVRTPTPQLYE